MSGQKIIHVHQLAIPTSVISQIQLSNVPENASLFIGTSTSKPREICKVDSGAGVIDFTAMLEQIRVQIVNDEPLSPGQQIIADINKIGSGSQNTKTNDTMFKYLRGVLAQETAGYKFTIAVKIGAIGENFV